MAADIDYIEQQILEEYEGTGTIEIRRWVEEYPTLKDHLLDFIFWVEGAPRQAEISDFAWTDEGALAQASARSGVQTALQKSSEDYELELAKTLAGDRSAGR